MDLPSWLCLLGILVVGLLLFSLLARRRRCPRCGRRAVVREDDDWNLGLSRWRCQACRAEYDRDWNEREPP